MSAKILNARDMDFILYEWLDACQLTQRTRYAEHTRETFDAALVTARQVAEKYFANHNRKGDEHEPAFDGKTVTLIPEIKAACDAVIETGLTRAGRDYEQGGMQLPHLLSQACFAWIQAANVSSSVYAFLAQSAASVIEKFGTDDQRRRYFEPMLTGRFFGTMCLTEPHAGSSLGDMRATAEYQADGTYRLRANKIFISAGEHDLSENIVHLVLAKIRGPEGVEPGVKGISLFIVPKFLVNDDGSVGARTDAAVMLDLLTPIIKAWPSEYGPRANDLAIQIHGGAGYTRDYIVEQHYRDNRLNPIHEGTNGIQSMDLLGRKLALDGGRTFLQLLTQIQHVADVAQQHDQTRELGDTLQQASQRLGEVARFFATQTSVPPATLTANAAVFLDFMGRIVMAWIWTWQANVAASALRDGQQDAAFYHGKLQAARYFLRWELPRTEQQAALLMRLDTTCLSMQDDWF